MKKTFKHITFALAVAALLTVGAANAFANSNLDKDPLGRTTYERFVTIETGNGNF